MPPALKRMETGLSSNAMPALTGFRVVLTTFASALAFGLAPMLAAQSSDIPAPTPAAAPTPAPAPAVGPQIEPKPRINLMVTVPRGEVNQAQVKQCVDEADAGTLSGEIVVCGELGDDGSNSFSGSRAAAQKRFAQETMLKGAPRAPDFIKDCKEQGNPFGCVGIGKVPPPALYIDVAALPKAPAGSDADRIARGLAPTGQDEQLTEEQERARREAAGIKTSVPPRPKKKGK